MTELLSIEDAAKALSLSPWTLRSHLRAGGAIVPVRCGRRVLISRNEIERIAREGLPSLPGPAAKKKSSASATVPQVQPAVKREATQGDKHASHRPKCHPIP